MATVIIPSFFRLERMRSRRFSTLLSSSDNECILRLIWRLSLSSLLSPGPLVPIPPPRRDILLPLPDKNGSEYLSCASSTCNLPSLDLALAAKISSMSMVLSTTLVSVFVSILLICDGVSSLSAIIRSISLFRQKAATSDILPLPIYVAGDGASSFCITVPIISAPAVSERRANSSIEISALYSPVSTPIKSALSGL